MGVVPSTSLVYFRIVQIIYKVWRLVCREYEQTIDNDQRKDEVNPQGGEVVKKGLELEYLLEGLKDLVTHFRKQESENMENLWPHLETKARKVSNPAKFPTYTKELSLEIHKQQIET